MYTYSFHGGYSGYVMGVYNGFETQRKISVTMVSTPLLVDDHR